MTGEDGGGGYGRYVEVVNVVPGRTPSKPKPRRLANTSRDLAGEAVLASVTVEPYGLVMIRLMSWNMKHLDLWDEIGVQGADVALLQEVPPPPGHADGAHQRCAACPEEVLPAISEAWRTAGWEKRPWRTAIARVTDAVQLEPVLTGDMTGTDAQALVLSRAGTITAANLTANGEHLFTAASVYSPWERPVGRNEPCWADGSAHRILSDLAPILWDQRRRPVVVAGDWNILFGYGEHGDVSFAQRYQTVFDRAESLGLRFVGPQHPNGRQADPWPEELPKASRCVPTFHHSQQKPETATRQLDFVFASSGIADKVNVRALNDPDDWGPSDHCRSIIDVDV